MRCPSHQREQCAEQTKLRVLEKLLEIGFFNSQRAHVFFFFQQNKMEATPSYYWKCSSSSRAVGLKTLPRSPPPQAAEVAAKRLPHPRSGDVFMQQRKSLLVRL